jgi:hypothetical protein
MSNALTPASILAASLALVPLSANAGDGHFEDKVDYITIVDSSDIGYDLAEQVGLLNYEGPVVLARTAASPEMTEGYILSLSFSSERMDPMVDHPIFELVDVEALEGAPMFLTDRLTPKNLVHQNEIDVEARDMAGFLDMNYAADDVYGELIDGIGEGDYLAVTHRKVSGRLDGQAVFGADVFDPSFISSLMIAEESGADFFGDEALAIVMNADGRVAAGFEERVKLLWLANGPNTQNEAPEQADGADEAAADGTSDKGSSKTKSLVNGAQDNAPSVDAATDLPSFGGATKAPAFSGVSFAPATKHTATLR